MLAFPFLPSSLLAVPGCRQLEAVDQDCILRNAALGVSPSGQSRAGERQFLVLFFSLPSCCSFSSSFRSCIFSLPYIAKAVLPCQKILLSFPSLYPTLLFMPILCSFTASPLLLHLYGIVLLCSCFVLFLLPTFLDIVLCSLHHARMSQGFVSLRALRESHWGHHWWRELCRKDARGLKLEFEGLGE